MTTTDQTADEVARPADEQGTDDGANDGDGAGNGEAHLPAAAEAEHPDEPVDAPARPSRFGLWLAAVAVLGLAIRLIYVFGWKNPGLNAGDAEYYHEGANFLADGRGYLHPFQLIRHGLVIPGADHPPGYLTVLAAFSFLGLTTFLQHQLISCVLGTLGVAAIGLAGRRIGGERVGILAALIVAVSPNVWFHDAMVMSESLVVATTALVLLTGYRWWDRPTLASAALFGLAVGAAALVRSEALLLGPFIAVPLLLWRRSRTGEAGGTGGSGSETGGLSIEVLGRQLAAAGGVAVLVIAPWVGYNVTRFENPVTLSAQFDHTLVSANCDEVFYGPSTGYWSRNCVEAAEPLTDPLDDASEEGVVFRRLARDYVEDHKARTVLVLGARVGRTFGLYQPENQVDLDDLYDGKEKGLGQAGLVVWYAVAIAAVAGMVGLRRAGRPIFPFVAIVAATVLTVLVTYGATRFRFPAELALCIPAAVSLDAAVTAFHRRRRPAPEGAKGSKEPEAPREANGSVGPTLAETEREGSPEAVSTAVPSGLGSSGGRFAGFDGLRAIAALGVLLTHVALASGLVARSGTAPYLARADVGVALFFVLSGFLLYRPFVAARLDGRDRPDTRRYLRHRFLRIFPAYWLALTVLAVVLDIRHLDQIRTPWDFVFYYGLLQSYSRVTALGGLQQAWTLTNEMAFYLILPLWALGAAWLARKLKPRQALVAELAALAAAGGAALAFRFWLHSFQVNDPTVGELSDFDPRFHWIIANFNMFVPGMALALLLEWSRRRDEPLAALELVRRHPLVCWAGAAVCFWAVSTRLDLTVLGTLTQRDAIAKELLYVGVGILLMAPVALAGDNLPRSLRWLSSRVMVTLGMLSYGIYLWHEGIIDIYRDTLDIQTEDGTYRLAGAFPQMLIVVVLATVAVAAVSYYLVERPALLLKDRDRKLFAAWRPVGLPADAHVVTVEERAAARAAANGNGSTAGAGAGGGAGANLGVGRRLLALGGRVGNRLPRWTLPAVAVGTVVAIPLWGLWKSPGPPMEEGFMLAFPERLLEGDIPNKDFLHLYGPGSLWTIAAFFKVFGVDQWVERLVGFLQLLALISGVTVLGYRWGRWVALVAGSITAVLILPPIGLTALAWTGGIAFALWAVIVAVKVFDPDEGLGDEADAAAGKRRKRILLLAGVLAGCALLFRPDLVLALGLPLGFMFVWGLDGRGRKHLVLGLAAGVSPYLVHMLLAGPGNAITGMVIEPVFVLRPGRTLPFPPPTDRMTSFLGGALLFRNWPWPFPALEQPVQVFVWVPILLAVTGTVVYVGWKARRMGSPEGWRLLCLGLLAVGILPQAIQRADVAHLDWVSCLPFGLLPLALAEWTRLRGIEVKVMRVLVLLPLAIMFVVIPHYTVRWYADYAGQSFGYRTEGVTDIHHRGRTFTYGREDVAAAAEDMLADIEEQTEPGDKLIVGTGDLRKTPYSEAFFYYLLPQLEPGTKYIEMDPGMANAEDSGLADELREADVVILSTLYDNWSEENTSRDFGSNEPNEVIESDYCLFERYGVQDDFTSPSAGRGLYELYLRDSSGAC
jgi:peptidoglycan/LPS O-acetylase OafA/YrhL/4-amino-4-deoxy-L-arabinose transferase-like glycosyltransferase